MKPRTVHYENAMQRGSYELTCGVGRYTHADFKPELTPAKMLRLGIFGGRYLNSCRDEYPESWFRHARISDDHARAELNHYGVLSGQPLGKWRANGWIKPHDPRGWFEWFCRYHRGRRIAGYDEWQIARWRSFGPRHIAQVRNNPHQPRLVQRQALITWAYDARNL